MLKNNTVKNLLGIVGEENVLINESELASFKIQDVLPEIAVFPDQVEQVSDIMKLASKESLSVITCGSGTKLALGNKPESGDILLSTKKINRIIEHSASDLVATTECGITLKKFQSELKKENQFLSVDPPHVNRKASVGGIIATNDSGPERLRYGTLREFLIGLKIVRADGSIFKGGSKVVKNVAGYDLPKLYVGSLGTLGIIVEATFRLYPVPECSETYLVSFSNLKECHDILLKLMDSNLVLTSLEILNLELMSAIAKRNNLDFDVNRYTLAIGIRNIQRAVSDQMSLVKAICNQNGNEGIIISGDIEEKLWEDIRNFPWRLFKTPRIVCKASSLITQIPSILETINKLSDDNGVQIFTSARAGNGIWIISIKGEISSSIDILNSLRSFLNSIGGSLILQEAPAEINAVFDTWGDLGSGLGIMKRIKANFDPQNLLNPGRYI